MKFALSFLLACLFNIALISNITNAQSVGASLEGTITDSAGAAVPKAQVIIRDVGTDAIHRVESDEAGRYHLPLLPSGDYEMKVSVKGFQSQVRRGITLAVGQSVVIDLSLSPGQVESTVTVEAIAGTTISTTNAALSGLVDQHQIRDLPLNGRSFTQLALLQTGVSAALAAGSDPVGGRTPKITINGARPEQNNFLLDGTDINNVYNKTPGSVGGVLLGVEAILEFQVLINAYSAEFGRSAGGVINAVTRSGANRYHGSLFEFHRNSAFDAKNFFDPANQPIPALKRNQFGGALGGPIRKDRTFFFATYEGLIEGLGVTGVAAVPDTNARQGRLPNKTVTLHPSIPTYLQLLFPLPNGNNLGGGAAEYLFSLSQPTDEHFVQGRIDHHVSEHDVIWGRFTFDNGTVDRQPTNKPPIAFTKERSRNQYLTIEHQHTFASGLLNTARFGFNRSVQEAVNVRTIDIPANLSFVLGEPFGFISIAGLVTELAGDFRLPRLDRLNVFQWGDTLFITKSRHALKIGAQGQRIQFNQDTVSQRGGVLNFANLENFLLGTMVSADVALPGLVDPIRGYRQSMFGFFVQDDYRFHSNLTFNLGLRYEFITTPTEVNGKISNLRQVSDAKVTAGDPWHNNPSLKNFAPRIGVAWDPFKNGKTSVRAGFGLFFDEILPKYYFFSGSLNPPFTTRTSITAPPFPNIVANFNPNAPIKAQLQTVNYDLQTPYMIQYNLSVQHTLPGNIDLTLAYAGSRGNHLLRLGDANLALETIVNGVKTYNPAAGRRNANFTGIFQRITDAQSFYNSAQISAVKRYSAGLRAQLSYTFSRSVDDSSGINSQDFGNVVQYGLDWYDRTIDRGLSAFHVKHNLAFNWTYDLPFGRKLTGLGGALLSGWQLNNIAALRSGVPFTVRLGFNRSGNLNTTGFAANERPNLKVGASTNPILGGPDRYFDVTAFELPTVNTRGTLGRNTLIGPGLVNIDASLGKSFKLGERIALQFRAEVFNLANHPNFAVPSGQVVFTNAQSAVAPTAGRITSTVTTARQIQLGAKFNF